MLLLVVSYQTTVNIAFQTLWLLYPLISYYWTVIIIFALSTYVLCIFYCLYLIFSSHRCFACVSLYTPYACLFSFVSFSGLLVCTLLLPYLVPATCFLLTSGLEREPCRRVDYLLWINCFGLMPPGDAEWVMSFPLDSLLTLSAAGTQRNNISFRLLSYVRSMPTTYYPYLGRTWFRLWRLFITHWLL